MCDKYKNTLNNINTSSEFFSNFENGNKKISKTEYSFLSSVNN